MNERIKQLKIQACKWASENATSTEYENMADQKFAELIVREAAGLVSSTQLTKDGHTWRSADLVVLEHFGVNK